MPLYALGYFASRIREGDDGLHVAIELELWMITQQVSYMGDHFNFSFSPRSSLLLHTFNISISQVQGTFSMDERYFDAPITIGFRPLWQDWQSHGRTLWNRYYLDYFVHFQRPIQLNFRSLPKTLMNTHFRQLCASWFQYFAACTVL